MVPFAEPLKVAEVVVVAWDDVVAVGSCVGAAAGVVEWGFALAACSGTYSGTYICPIPGEGISAGTS